MYSMMKVLWVQQQTWYYHLLGPKQEEKQSLLCERYIT